MPSRTVATVPVSLAAFREVYATLDKAHYHDALQVGRIDMNGLALEIDDDRENPDLKRAMDLREQEAGVMRSEIARLGVQLTKAREDRKKATINAFILFLVALCAVGVAAACLIALVASHTL